MAQLMRRAPEPVHDAVMATFDWKRPNYDAIYARRAEWLSELRADPSVLAAVKAHYKTNPVDFITDWGFTFDPRNPEIGLPAVIPFVLFPRQEQFIDWLLAKWRARDDGLLEKSRDMGVTWLCVGFAVWMWLFHPETVVGFGSRKEEYVDKLGDPKSIFWMIRAFISLLPDELKPVGYIEARHAPHMRILNPENGSSIIGEAGDNIGRGARTSIYFKDESSHYEHAMAIEAALSMTSNCKIDIGTANGVGNPFHTKRASGKIDVFTFHWRQDPRKDDAWYAEKKRKLDSVIVAAEIDIDYEAAQGNAFIPGELVTVAQSKGPADVPANGPIQFGLDVARFGNNKSVLTCRRGRVVLFQREWQGIALTDLVNHVATEVKAFPLNTVGQIAVDVIGVGAGVADMLRVIFPGVGNTPSIVVDVNSAERVDDGVNWNLRSQMWDNGREWMKLTPNVLPNSPDLKTQLCSVTYKFKAGLRLLEAKEDLEKRGIKSPDHADSLMLTFAKPCVSPRKQPTTAPFVPRDASMGMLG